MSGVATSFRAQAIHLRLPTITDVLLLAQMTFRANRVPPAEKQRGILGTPHVTASARQ